MKWGIWGKITPGINGERMLNHINSNLWALWARLPCKRVNSSKNSCGLFLAPRPVNPSPRVSHFPRWFLTSLTRICIFPIAFVNSAYEQHFKSLYTIRESLDAFPSLPAQFSPIRTSGEITNFTHLIPHNGRHFTLPFHLSGIFLFPCSLPFFSFFSHLSFPFFMPRNVTRSERRVAI